MTVVSRNGKDDTTNELNDCLGLNIDTDNQSIVIADLWNHRIVEWKIREKNEKVMAGGRGQGNQLD